MNANLQRAKDLLGPNAAIHSTMKPDGSSKRCEIYLRLDRQTNKLIGEGNLLSTTKDTTMKIPDGWAATLDGELTAQYVRTRREDAEQDARSLLTSIVRMDRARKGLGGIVSVVQITNGKQSAPVLCSIFALAASL